MNRFGLPLAIFAVLVIVFAVALKRAPDKQFVKSALIGKPAAEFTLPDLLKSDGKVSNAAFRGRWHLINVWGTWCKECYGEHPVLLQIRKEGKVAVLGIDYPADEANEEEKARQWLQELGNPYEAVAVDREGRTLIDYGVYGAPESFLVNPEGVIVEKVVGQITVDSWNKLREKFIDGARP